LLLLERHAHLANKPDWLLPRAVELFDAALAKAWDHQHGGIYYGFAPDGSICDDLKYFWVQAESLATAALLAAAPATLLDLVRQNLGLQLGAFRRPPARRLVPHPRRRQQQADRREKPGRQSGLSHHGRLLRSAQRIEEGLRCFRLCSSGRSADRHDGAWRGAKHG
jgi:hypothetical protein